MSAYMVITVSISDRDKFLGGYAPAAAALVDKFGGRYVIRAPVAEILEGDVPAVTSDVISEWPDKATALAFWNSDEYQSVKTLREGISDATVVIVETPNSAPTG
jgi:uncharacterized protein (DUF1330 family)